MICAGYRTFGTLGNVKNQKHIIYNTNMPTVLLAYYLANIMLTKSLSGWNTHMTVTPGLNTSARANQFHFCVLSETQLVYPPFCVSHKV